MAGSIRRRGKQSWELTVDHGRGADGKRRRLYESFRGSKKEASQRLTQLLAERDGGTELSPRTTTVREWLDQWLAGRTRALAPSTVELYRLTIDRWLKPLHPLALRELKSYHVQQVLVADHSASTQRLILAVLNRALRDAVRLQLLSRNPAEYVERPRRVKTEQRVIPEDRLGDYLAACSGSLYPLVYLALNTGARASELTSLQWQDIDLSAGRVTFRRVSKTASSVRSVEIGPAVVAVLQQHRISQAAEKLRLGTAYSADRGLVFTHEGRAVSRLNVYDHWRRALQSAGLPHVRLHDLRHTAATLLLGTRVPVKVVAEMLGHASTKTTMDTYMHVLPTMQQEAAAVLDEKIRRQAVGNSPD